MTDPDHADLARYLRGDDELSAAYRRLPQPAPPRLADRRVLRRARRAVRRRPRREALAYAASALLALAVLFAFEIHPGERRHGADAPHFVRTAMHIERGAAWEIAGTTAVRRIDPPRCARPEPMPPAQAGDAARSPRTLPSTIAEAPAKLREPCSPRRRLR